jgi:HEPN domain-containing protein
MPSQFRSEEAATWLQFAADDLDTARVLLGAMPPRVRQSLFHAQQAAEKSLKAFLIWQEQPFPLTHDLAVLLRLCVSIDSGIASGVEPALDLTQFAARFRYPGEDEIPSLEEARQWVAAAAGVLDCVSLRIAGGKTGG